MRVPHVPRPASVRTENRPLADRPAGASPQSDGISVHKPSSLPDFEAIRKKAKAKATAAPGSRRKRRVIQEGETPTGALVWNHWRERNAMLIAWRTAMWKLYPKSARAMRLAWLLRDLMANKGYADASDGYLQAKTEMGLHKVEQMLTSFERRGAIVRGHIRLGPIKYHRRIFPAAAVLETVSTNPPTWGDKRPSDVGGDRLNKRGANRTRETSTQRVARLDAERRDKRQTTEKDEADLDQGRA